MMKRVHRLAAGFTFFAAAAFICIVEFLFCYPGDRHPWRYPLSFGCGIVSVLLAIGAVVWLVVCIYRSPSRLNSFLVSLLTFLFTAVPFIILCVIGEGVGSMLMHYFLEGHLF